MIAPLRSLDEVTLVHGSLGFRLDRPVALRW
jgi:hypothetical protein